MAEIDYGALERELRAAFPEMEIVTDPMRTFAYGADASFYRLTPKIVVIAENEQQVIRLLALCRSHRAPVTFRAAGTSLSGQAVTDSVLVFLGEGFRGFGIDSGGEVARLGPSLVGGDANRLLSPFGRKIGPDPASIATAKIGGIAANNASGMCCGTGQNSYHTLASMRIVLADGAVLDTADPQSVAAFRASHRALLDGLAAVSRDARADTATAERIRYKFRLKNTTGYAINALVDFDDPVDILTHLMIGSEGTLGFLSRIDYKTVPEYRDKASTFIVFADLPSACRAVSALKKTSVEAVELLDRASLESVKHKKGMPIDVDALGPGAAALLVEARGPDRATLDARIAEAQGAVDAKTTLNGVAFSHDPVECQRYWDIRKGTFPAVGGKRPAGTTVIIEDVAFPVERLAEATVDLQSLLNAHGYDKAIIFGHALEGNLHFVFAQGFDEPSEIARYSGFMEALADLVVGKYDGSLKAEHGTGRNMAPFVEREWGVKATDLMRRIKSLLDPENLINPGVVLNDDPKVHLKNLKPLPKLSPLVDSCIECGFCEPQCPSHGLTFSPRQRIVASRELARLRCDAPNAPNLAEMQATYDYAGDTTCSTCSLCATVCPLEINTGEFIRAQRAAKAGPLRQKIGGAIGDHFSATLGATRVALAGVDVAHKILGTSVMNAAARLAHDKFSAPLWTPAFPRADWPQSAPPSVQGQPALFFESCASRAMGPPRGDDSEDLRAVAARVFARAGYSLVTPEGEDELCCGQPFASKGLPGIAEHKVKQLAQKLSSGQRKIPVVFDMSQCAQRAKAFSTEDFAPLDLVEFLSLHVAPKLKLRPVPGPVALHITCSVRKMGLADAMLGLAKQCASEVIAPPDVKCCGFAGDKGFSNPELNEFALRHLNESLPSQCREGYSTSRTCEIGLASYSGRRYRSILHLLDQASA
ncbi:FAD-binding and (Fe-S)-binding domain-containing protein [uncultured Rhodoblastus sp.]|uniref:FAD-binding and (Fe-S)-binding domain-containing protein n=1 Tax=uncultured Rhodoblastus sp. TaxID=543037 RepID=UPI0025E06297|nr:FAD-binding and (Fe-S)-binding domain-containing protein [uncultured Rhodoblastus sp.]